MPFATSSLDARALLVDPDVRRLLVECNGHPPPGDNLTPEDRRATVAPIRRAARQLACALEHHPADATLPTTDDPAFGEHGWATNAVAEVLYAIELAYAHMLCSCQRDSRIPESISDACSRVIIAARSHSAPDGHGAIRQALAEWLDAIVTAAHALEHRLGEHVAPQTAIDYLDATMAGNGFAWWIWALRQDMPRRLRLLSSRLVERARRYGDEDPAAAARMQFITAELSGSLSASLRLEDQLALEVGA